MDTVKTGKSCLSASGRKVACVCYETCFGQLAFIDRWDTMLLHTSYLFPFTSCPGQNELLKLKGFKGGFFSLKKRRQVKLHRYLY